jgi:hypothetical protein
MVATAVHRSKSRLSKGQLMVLFELGDKRADIPLPLWRAVSGLLLFFDANIEPFLLPLGVLCLSSALGVVLPTTLAPRFQLARQGPPFYSNDMVLSPKSCRSYRPEDQRSVVNSNGPSKRLTRWLEKPRHTLQHPF